MDARQQRGLAIAATARITKKGDAWVVPSQSLNGRYTVTMDDDGYHAARRGGLVTPVRLGRPVHFWGAFGHRGVGVAGTLRTRVRAALQRWLVP